MPCQNLRDALEPKSVAVIGASKTNGSLGRAIYENMLASGFSGDLWPVNPKYRRLNGNACFMSVTDLPGSVDLAAIATPPHTIAGLLHDLAAKDCKAAVIITAGLSADQESQLRDISRKFNIRLFGPNCLGLIAPHANLNASFAHLMPAAGNLAFISQSGAILTSVIDWAAIRKTGFSGLVSMGNAIDVSMSDLLLHFAEDPQTSAILIYMEAIGNAAEFMSAASHAARSKPVIVLKVGRSEKAAAAVISHTGAMAGADDVYEAAFERAGVVRVDSLEELFDVGELLSGPIQGIGNRIGVVTNGGGLGIIAADQIERSGLEMAPLNLCTIEKLDHVLPPIWSKSNPIDIIGDADERRYLEAVRIALQDNNIDTLLILNCPTSVASGEAIARALAGEIETLRGKKNLQKSVIASFAGGETAALARRILDRADIANFDTPEDAISAIQTVLRYRSLQAGLLRKPAATTPAKDNEKQRVSSILEGARADGRTVLSEDEAKNVIAAYDIETARTLFVNKLEEIGPAAEEILSDSKACVVKVVSPDLSHKSEAGGVRLNIKSSGEAKSIAKEMLQRISKDFPHAVIDGFTVQPMIDRPQSFQTIIGINRDPTFGPIILFGAGGTAVEVIGDKAIGLPPLDNHLARDMIEKTRIAKLLAGYRHVPPADIEALEEAIIAVSRLACDFPEIAELDINPVIVDDKGVVALDARISLRGE